MTSSHYLLCCSPIPAARRQVLRVPPEVPLMVFIYHWLRNTSGVKCNVKKSGLYGASFKVKTSFEDLMWLQHLHMFSWCLTFLIVILKCNFQGNTIQNNDSGYFSVGSQNYSGEQL